MTRIQTLDELNILFADFIQEKLGLEAEQVRISYETYGQKAPKFGETVIYVHVEQIHDDISAYKNREMIKDLSGLFITSQSSMRVLELSCSIYGKDCDTLATKLKEYMYFESSRMFFEVNNLALFSDRIQISNKIHELINERWWDRVDLKVGFYNSITVDEEIYPFEEVVVNISSEDIQVVIGG